MRSPQKSNRARGRGGRKPNGNILNRVFESAGPDGKVRGTPQQIVDKYLTLARDAQTSGDRVKAENFLQHAEHYQRMLLEAMAQREQRREFQPADPAQTSVQGPASAAVSPAIESAEPARPGSGNGPVQAEVGGLTTIDPVGGEAESLLVEGEESPARQPRRRRGRGNGHGTAPRSGEGELPPK